MASAFEIIAAGVVGALIGSFLNVVIWRLPRDESIVSPGSRCPSCERPISSYDNVPVVSWLLLRGRCRHCGAQISPRYPLVELLTAAAFALVVAVLGFDEQLVLELPFVACLIALAGIDYDHQLLPNKIVYPMAVYGLVATLLVDRDDLVENLIAGAGGFLFLFVALVAYPARHGHGRREAGRRDGPLPGPVDRPRDARSPSSPARSWAWASSPARARRRARRRCRSGSFLALGGIAGLLAGPELIELYEDNFLD